MDIKNVHEAKTQFSRLLARVAAGEEIGIARAGKPERLVFVTRDRRIRDHDVEVLPA